MAAKDKSTHERAEECARETSGGHRRRGYHRESAGCYICSVKTKRPAHSESPDAGDSFLGFGWGWIGFLAKWLRIDTPISRATDDGSEGVGGSGTASPTRKAKQVATKDTTVACTWSKMRFPMTISLLTPSASVAPVLAAVPSRAERFISRFPLRLRITGMRMTSSSIRLMGFQF